MSAFIQSFDRDVRQLLARSATVAVGETLPRPLATQRDDRERQLGGIRNYSIVSEHHGSFRAWQFKRPVILLFRQIHFAQEHLVAGIVP
jgi:hypothetical protein